MRESILRYSSKYINTEYKPIIIVNRHSIQTNNYCHVNKAIM